MRIAKMFDTSPPKSVPTNKNFPVPVRIGLELELENFRLREETNVNHIRIIPDGSLRNNGIELVFRGGYSGKDISTALQEVRSLIDITNPSLSPRTSMHVHLDCHPLTVDQTENVFLCMLLFESLLFSYAGDQRRTNIFCMPLYTDQGFLLNARRYFLSLNKEDYGAARRVINAENNKYASINLFNIMRLGTLEVRMHPGTMDTQVMTDWINILSYIYEYGANQDVMTLCHSLSEQGIEGMLASVFPEDLAGQLASLNNAAQQLLDGTRVVQQYFIPQIHKLSGEEFTQWASKHYKGV